MSREKRAPADLLTGEWACLGLLVEAPAHGFALSQRLAPTGDIGRIWSLSRSLTYRAVDQLVDRGFIEVRGEQPGLAGGNRTLLAPTRSGRSAFRSWVTSPVSHLRDLRSELLLKVVLARLCSIPIDAMIEQQRSTIRHINAGLVTQLQFAPDDLVLMWRRRSTEAALRFLDDLNGMGR